MPSILEPHINQNSFLTTTGEKSTLSPDSVIVYFIPGNPGLISYYNLFLSLLSSDLSEKKASSSSSSSDADSNGVKDDTIKNDTQADNSDLKAPYIIHGQSMGGFEIPEPEQGSYHSTESKTRTTPSTPYPPTLYGLAEQILFMEKNLETFVHTWQDAVQAEHSLEKRPRAKVILIGHSVGAYVAMEMMRRRREKVKVDEKLAADGDGDYDYDYDDGVDVIGGILLFPTVVDIAKSPSGQTLTMLLYIPYLALLASLLAGVLVSVLPGPALRRIVSTVMKNPREEVVDTTVSMLTNKSIIRQALHMAADEMIEIGADKWSDEIWGLSGPPEVSNQQNKLAKLVFYFGRNDHWVAEQTRDEIIRARAPDVESTGGRDQCPKMMVCDSGIVHGFCIRHNDIMAKKVGGFVRNIIKAHERDDR